MTHVVRFTSTASTYADVEAAAHAECARYFGDVEYEMEIQAEAMARTAEGRVLVYEGSVRAWRKP